MNVLVSLLVVMIPWVIVIIISVLLFRTQELLECSEKRLLMMAQLVQLEHTLDTTPYCDDYREDCIGKEQDVL